MLTSSPQLSGYSIRLHHVAVRGQGSNPGAGNLVIFVPYLVFHHIFLLVDNMSLMSSYTETHIFYHRIDCTRLLKK